MDWKSERLKIHPVEPTSFPLGYSSKRVNQHCFPHLLVPWLPWDDDRVCVFLVAAKCPLIITLGDTMNDDRKDETKLFRGNGADMSGGPCLDLPIKKERFLSRRVQGLTLVNKTAGLGDRQLPLWGTLEGNYDAAAHTGHLKEPWFLPPEKDSAINHLKPRLIDTGTASKQPQHPPSFLFLFFCHFDRVLCKRFIVSEEQAVVRCKKKRLRHLIQLAANYFGLCLFSPFIDLLLFAVRRNSITKDGITWCGITLCQLHICRAEKPKTWELSNQKQRTSCIQSSQKGLWTVYTTVYCRLVI